MIDPRLFFGLWLALSWWPFWHPKRTPTHVEMDAMAPERRSRVLRREFEEGERERQAHFRVIEGGRHDAG
jgi:hypothetical protein